MNMTLVRDQSFEDRWLIASQQLAAYFRRVSVLAFEERPDYRYVRTHDTIASPARNHLLLLVLAF